jgi:nitrogen fixation protein NifU and related proteins
MAKYTEIYQSHLASPRNVGRLSNPTGIGNATHPPCGDLMQLFVRVEDERIVAATFEARVCPAGIACASWLVERVAGVPVEEAVALGAREIFRVLGLSADDAHAAWLALKALQGALQAAAGRQLGRCS